MKKHVSFLDRSIHVFISIFFIAFLLLLLASPASSQRIQKRLPMVILNLPDLVVESIEASPKELIEGNTVELKSTVRNSGKAEAKGFNIDFLIDGKVLHRWPDLSLNPNITFTAQIPKQIISGAGIHNFTCRVDPENKVSESNEKNNEKTFTFTVRKESETAIPPDTAVISISITPPNPMTTDTIKFSATIKNVGQKVIENVPVSVGWRYNKKGESRWRYESMFSNNIGRLSPGETMQAKVDTLSFRIQEIGDYLFEVDELVLGGSLYGKEVNLADNHLSTEFKVSETTLKSDLLVKEISVEPSIPSKGSRIVLRALIANNGAESNYFATRMKLLKNNQTLNEWTEGTSPGLYSGGSHTFQTVVQGLETGVYSIDVEVDYEQNNQEIDEQNNRKSFNFEVKEEGEKLVPPDIAAIGVSIIPQNPKTGESIRFSVTIKNVGQRVIENVPVSAGWRYKKKDESRWRYESMFSNNISRLSFGETMEVKQELISFATQEAGDYLFEIDELVLGGELYGQEANLNDNHMSIEFRVTRQ